MGAATCTACSEDRGETSNDDHTACVCAVGYYLQLGSDACVGCPKGTTCSDKDVDTTTLTVIAGYWHESGLSAILAGKRTYRACDSSGDGGESAATHVWHGSEHGGR